MIPNSMRTLGLEQKYQQDKLNGVTKDLSEVPALKEWNHWRLIENAYPYDLIYKTHHMLIPITLESKTEKIEHDEFYFIIRDLEADYDLWFVNMAHRQSVHNLFHVHLACFKDRGDIK